MISKLTICYISQLLALVQPLTLWTSQSSPTHNVPAFMAVSLLTPRSVVLPLAARALAMWVFHLDILYNSLLTVHNTKLAANTRTTPTVTSFHCSISVVQSVLLPIVNISIGPKSVCNMINFFSRAFSLNFLASMWQS